MKKQRAAKISVISNSALVISKLVVGLMMGSVSVISEAIHSGIDLIAALIAYFAIKKSNERPDKEHPFGHGKFENFSAAIEATLILVAAGIIIHEAINKIINKTEVESFDLGIIVMLVSVIVNTIVSRYLFKVAKETDSVALEADALHLSTDVYTSLGILVGLILIKITNIQILDPIFALLVAAFIIKEGVKMVKKASIGLLDTSLSEDELKIIKEVLMSAEANIMEFHKLRSRKAGQERHIDLHLVVDGTMTVREAHTLCDSLEKQIKERLSNSLVLIHVEPCPEGCKNCNSDICKNKRK